MNLGEQLLGALSLYGLPLLCAVTFIASVGAPLPVSLLLIAAGSFADHGEMNGPLIVLCATAAAVGGDLIGFFIGRWGDRTLARRLARQIGGEERLAAAELHARKWGGVGIFLTRWLITPLGPFINLVSGFAGYPWSRFLLWDAAGEFLWVALYVMVGQVFSHQVQALSSVIGNLTWAVLLLGLAVFLAWKLVVLSKTPTIRILTPDLSPAFNEADRDTPR